MTATERWLPVIGWEGAYEVSDFGRVRTQARIAIRSNGVPIPVKAKIRALVWSGPKHKQYLSIELRCNGRTARRRVHHLVLEAFVGLRPTGTRGLHWDDDEANNRLDNLRWGTQSDNLHDQVRNGIHPMAKKTECKRGHDLMNPENVYRMPSSNRRQCRLCRDARLRDRRMIRSADPQLSAQDREYHRLKKREYALAKKKGGVAA